MRLNSLGSDRSGKALRKRVGRGIGSGVGKTAGRGHKGQKSRAGGKVPAGFEGGQMPLQMRLPKFGFNSVKARLTAEVRLSELDKLEAEIIDIESLKSANLIKNSIKRVRIIASGTVTKPLVLKGLRVTAGAQTAVEKAGGKIEETE
ncbi:MAG: 50S ribosomal protein L15 [Gammaproteobacteria bacterium TMED1]|nr:MAG: 50S ribosomal protein L15 [Gammaproteobacteria bacterium TMED1]